MNYTDNQLKAALAKMLPKKLQLVPYGREDNMILCWKDGGRPVFDTELLHLCWLVEDVLFIPKYDEYTLNLEDLEDDLECPIHSKWQNRVIALAKAKGIKI